MDWAGLWTFLSTLSGVLILVFLLRGGTILDFFREMYEARQERLESVANARVREKELQLEIEKERNKPKNPITVDDIVAEERSYEGYRENVPQQQQ